MKLLTINCALLLLAVCAQAEDIMFFADDHYKSLGRPVLAASAADPALQPGEGALHINLANQGELEELIPINLSGDPQDILQEMKEEMNGSHARNIQARLIGAGPVQVTSGPESVEDLPAGEKVLLQYNVSVMKNATGWMKLLLDVAYERQADVSVKKGVVYPLNEAERETIGIDVFLAGDGEPLRVFALGSGLHPGESSSLKAAISNGGREELHGCSARLLAAPPFLVQESNATLGDLSPGSIALAQFDLQVDGEARAQDYQMGCQVCCRERCASLPLTVTVQPAGWMDSWGLPALVGLAALAAILAWRGRLLAGDKRRRRIRLP